MNGRISRRRHQEDVAVETRMDRGVDVIGVIGLECVRNDVVYRHVYCLCVREGARMTD